MVAWLLKMGRICVGIGLVIVGLLALVTPLTPGAWLIFVGLEMLGWRVAYGRYIHDVRLWIKRRLGRSDPEADSVSSV